MTQQISIPADE